MAPARGLEVAERSFEFLRSHTRILLGLAAFVVVPVELFVAYANRALYQNGLLSSLTGNASTSLNQFGPSRTFGSSVLPAASALVGELLSWIGLALMAGPVARIVSAEMTGRRISMGEALRLPAKSWASLVVACLIVHVAEFVGIFAAGAGSCFAMSVFAIVSPIVSLEVAGPFKAIARAWTLSLRRLGPVLGLVMAMSLVTSLLSVAIAALPTTLTSLVGFTGGWVLAGIGRVSATLVTFSVTSVFVAFLYIDLRSWTEGIDILVEVSQPES